VFKGILSNTTFIVIFIGTIGLQIIIVQFGGEVFKIDSNGLGVAGWTISVLCGLGSLVVGLLVRIAPPMPLPAFMLADYKEEHDDDKMEKLDVDDVKASRNLVDLSAPPKEAIFSRTSTCKSVKPFQISPTDSNTELAYQGRPSYRRSTASSAPQRETWWTSFYNSIFPRRLNRDVSTIVVVNPRQVRPSIVRMAKERHA
jgi:hypothetical protein